MAVVHGAGNFYIGAAATTYGEIQSYTENETIQIDEALDAGGSVFEIATRDLKVEATMEVVTVGALPTAGAIIALAGKNAGNIMVTAVNINESNSDHQKATINGVRYITNAKPL